MDRCRYMRDDDYCVVRAIVVTRRDPRLAPAGEGAYAECERCKFNLKKMFQKKRKESQDGKE